MLTHASVLCKARERSLLNPCETLAFSFVLHFILCVHCEQQSNQTTAYVLGLHLVFMLRKFHDHDGYENLVSAFIIIIVCFRDLSRFAPIGALFGFTEECWFRVYSCVWALYG